MDGKFTVSMHACWRGLTGFDHDFLPHQMIEEKDWAGQEHIFE